MITAASIPNHIPLDIVGECVYSGVMEITQTTPLQTTRQEDSMTSYTDTQVQAAAAVVEAEGNDFSFGKPDERDFVRMVQRGAGLAESHNGDEDLERIADELYEDSGETVTDSESLARFVLSRLV